MYKRLNIELLEVPSKKAGTQPEIKHMITYLNNLIHIALISVFSRCALQATSHRS